MPQVVAAVAIQVLNTVMAITGSGALALALSNFVYGFASWRGIAQLAYMAYSLTRKPPRVIDPGAARQFRADPQAPRRFVFGETATAGVPVFGTTYYDNGMLAYVVAISAGQCEGFVEFRVDNEPVTLGTTVGGGWNGQTDCVVSGKFAQQMWMSARTGDGSAYTKFGFGSAQYVPEWTANHTLRGVHHAVWLMWYDKAKYAQGVPQPTWLFRGQKCYDPRKDSTYPGGSGPHRLANPATWEFTRNGALQALKWANGIFENGKLIGGIGLPIDLLHVGSFVTAANVADANGWTCDGVISGEDDKAAAMAAICATFGGEFVSISGRLGVTFAAAQVAALTLDDDDAAGPLTLNATRTYRDRRNAARARYVEPNDRYTFKPCDTVTSSIYVGEDGGKVRTLEFDLPMVSNRTQAAQLSALRLADTREHRSITGLWKPRARMVAEGQTVVVNSATLGINEKYFVERRQLQPDGSVSLALRLETDSKYSWAMGQTQTPPLPATYERFDPINVTAPTPAEWTAMAVEISAGGARFPIIRLTGACTERLASSIVVEFRPHSETDWRPHSEVPTSATNIEINGLTPSTSYDVAVSYRVVGSDVVTPRYVYLGIVTTGRMSATDATSVDGFTGSQLTAQFESLFDLQLQATLISDRTRQFIDVLGYTTDPVSGLNLPLGNTLNNVVTQQLDGDTAIIQTVSLIGAKTIDGTAFVLDGTTVKVSPTETLASRLTTLSAADSANAASITSLSNAMTTADTALASSVTSLSTTVNGHTSTLSVYGSSINGLSARYGVRLDVNGRVSGFVANNDGAQSDFIIISNKFALVDPGAPGGAATVPFSYAGGVLKMSNVEVDTVKANVINTAQLIAGSVTTDRIIGAGVTNGNTAFGTDGAYAATSTPVNTVSLNVTTSGFGVVDVEAYVDVFSNAGSHIITAYLKRGGTTLRTWARNAVGSGVIQPVRMLVTETLAAGSYTYTLEVADTQAFFTERPTLRSLERKR